MTKSLQETFAKNSICFGCGPANENGLQIKSFVDGDNVIAHFTPKEYYHAFPNVLCGGIIGTLLDCHCNWSAAWYLMQQLKLSEPPCTVTAEYTITLKRPTSMSTELILTGRLIEINGKQARIAGELIANGKVCDTCEGTFVAVNEGHPAFHRW